MLVMPDCVFSEHVVVGKWDFSLTGCFLDFWGVRDNVPYAK